MSSISNIHIRLAAADDAPAIVALLSESFAEYKSLYTPGGYAATAIAQDEVANRIEAGSVWVAVRDGIIEGTVSVVPKGKSLYIRGMAVLPVARGQHIGELLLTHTETFATMKMYERLLLSTTPFLDRAIRLYERFGFRRTGEGPHELFGTPLFAMEKRLDLN